MHKEFFHVNYSLCLKNLIYDKTFLRMCMASNLQKPTLDEK